MKEIIQTSVLDPGISTKQDTGESRIRILNVKQNVPIFFQIQHTFLYLGAAQCTHLAVL